RLPVAVEQIVGRGLLCLVRHDDPAAIVVRLALNAELETLESPLQQSEIASNARSNVDPFLSCSGYTNCFDFIRRGVQDNIRAIRRGMLSNYGFLVGRPVVPAICSSLATHTGQQEHTFVTAIEDPSPGRRAVFVGHIAPRSQRRTLNAPQPRAAVEGIAARVPGSQMPIKADVEELMRVLPDKCALTGGKIDAIKVVPARITVVNFDGDFARSLQGPQAELDVDVGEWRDVTHGVPNRIDYKQMMVLIAGLIVEKHQKAAVRGPILPVDWTALYACHWLAGLDVRGRSHPHVEHAVHGGKPRDPTAIWRHFCAEERRIVEQGAAGNE